MFNCTDSQTVHFLSGCILFALLSGTGLANAAVGDGPRAYQVAPIGTRVFTVIAAYEDSTFNLDGSPSDPSARIDTDALAFQFTNIFRIKDKTAGLVILVPAASVEGELIGAPQRSSSSGIGDIQVGVVVGLVGSPAMDAQQYANFDPGFSFGLLGKVGLPTGDYDADSAINIGTNRWSAQFGSIFAWNFGERLLPGHQTTFELVTSAWIYGDNDDPNNGGARMEQDNLYVVEMHVTHDFSKRFWGSVNALYTDGGETTTDGVAAGNATDNGGLGVTVGINLSRGMSLQLGYGQTIDADIDGLDDRLLRLKFGMVF